MLLIRARPISVVLGLLVASCACLDPIYPCPCEDPTCPCLRDAAPDAARDAGRDGGRSTSLDASRDAAMGTAEWTPLRGLPSDCRVEHARRPERLPAPQWEGCGPGCQRSDDVWASRTGFFRDGRGWLVMLSDDLGATQAHAIAPVDGLIAGAWRVSIANDGPTCILGWETVNQGMGAFTATFVSDAAMRVEDRVYAAPLTALPATDEPTVLLEPPRVELGRHLQELAASPDLLAMRIGAGEIVVSRGGTLLDVFSAPASEVNHVGAHDDHVVFAETQGEWRLMHWTPENGVEPYYDPPEQVGEPLLDGETLVWIRFADFVGGVATRAELWTSPFVRRGADVTPRMVHPRVEPGAARLGDGIYGWMRSIGPGAEARLVDLATGRERSLRPPSGFGCSALVYVSRREVALSCVAPGGAPSVLLLDPSFLATDAS